MAGLFNALANFPKHQAPVTPSDTVALYRPGIVECLTAGNLVGEDKDGTIVTRAMEPGQLCPVYLVRVRAATTGTYVVLWD